MVPIRCLVLVGWLYYHLVNYSKLQTAIFHNVSIYYKMLQGSLWMKHAPQENVTRSSEQSHKHADMPVVKFWCVPSHHQTLQLPSPASGITGGETEAIWKATDTQLEFLGNMPQPHCVIFPWTSVVFCHLGIVVIPFFLLLMIMFFLCLSSTLRHDHRTHRTHTDHI